MVTLSTRTVQANVKFAQPAAIVPPSVPAVPKAAPDSLTPQRTVAARHKGLIQGLASWYGGVFNGRTTASGERYDMYAMTACHPTLPFGSLVRVVNVNNGRSVVVRITDRGDLAEGRIIDLSYGAAEVLAMTNAGLAPVRLDVLSRGAKPNQGQH
ncbi:MAG TPA: septal ring lytic transglycosylase RlpA family protein [Terracidiphilus sp.]|nr:septal ring lytic transglycosylase RlpA family protein [Terracidiphilus sp.]